MKHLIRSYMPAAVIVGCALATSACDPALGPSAETQMPRPGLTLEIEEFDFNAFGARIVSPLDPPDTNYITVSPNTSAAYGLAPVARMVLRPDTASNKSGDTIFTAFFANGDMAALQPFDHTNLFDHDPRWITFPFGQKGTRTVMVLDTTFTRGNVSHRFRETWTTRFLGSDLVDTTNTLLESKLGDLKTVKAEIVQVVDSLRGFNDDLGDPIPWPRTTVHTIWFSPKLGAIVRWHSVRATMVRGQPQGGGHGFTTIGWWQR